VGAWLALFQGLRPALDEQALSCARFQDSGLVTDFCLLDCLVTDASHAGLEDRFAFPEVVSFDDADLE
jgi:hypothetical protein